MTIDEAAEWVAALKAGLAKAIIGQQQAIDAVLVALLAGGHVLIEGVPGLGKTLLVQALAKLFAAQFQRVQFTPDLLPADITGGMIFDHNSGEFRLHRGPIFAHFILADEINRAPAKTQAALLEVMQEKQVTIERHALPVPQPFMVLATQNPSEQEGTYRLPEAQLDRFLLTVPLDYPSEDTESALLQRILTLDAPLNNHTEAVPTLCSPEQLAALQASLFGIRVDARIVAYVVALVRQTRDFAGIALGASPRAGIALLLGARAAALLAGRDFVLPEDVQALAEMVLAHRLTLTPAAEIADLRPADLVQRVLAAVSVPRA